jgi:DNA-directed RNA polymerase subunit H (RpoH/RPB5)
MKAISEDTKREKVLKMYEISYKLLPPQKKDEIMEQYNQKVRWKECR